MKRKAKFLREAMLCLLFISLLFLKIQTVDAAVAQDYFTQISPKGVVRSGTIFTTDKQVIRPEYQGDWDELLNEVVDKDDNPFLQATMYLGAILKTKFCIIKMLDITKIDN